MGISYNEPEKLHAKNDKLSDFPKFVFKISCWLKELEPEQEIKATLEFFKLI